MRNYISIEEKFNIIKSVNTDISAVEICIKYGIVASIYYKWKCQLFQSAKNGPSENNTYKSQEKENNELKSMLGDKAMAIIELNSMIGKFITRIIAEFNIHSKLDHEESFKQVERKYGKSIQPFVVKIRSNMVMLS